MSTSAVVGPDSMVLNLMHILLCLVVQRHGNIDSRIGHVNSIMRSLCMVFDCVPKLVHHKDLLVVFHVLQRLDPEALSACR